MNHATRLLAIASTLGAVAGTPTAAAAACDVVATVLDADERPVVGMDVRLADGAAPRHEITDQEGRVRFAAVASPTTLTAHLAEGGPRPRFIMVRGGQPIQMTASVDPAKGCTITLGESHPAQLALYQGLRRGFALMEQLGIDPGPPLSVEVDDPVASAHAAYWVGTSSFNPDDTMPPRMVLGTHASSAEDSDAPDNREYHELGHHALAAAFGALPRSRDDTTEGGYHHNPSSSQAWTEGFAIFFAAMVAQRIEQRPDAGRYRVEGAWIDLELNYRPWDLRGAESVAVASLLWDLVDTDRPGHDATLQVMEPRLLTDAGVPHLLVGRVDNTGTDLLTEARVRVEGPDFSATAPVGPRLLPGGGQGWFALPVPEGIAAGDDPLAALKLTATPHPAATDDDPVAVEPSEVWTAIAEFRSEKPDGNGRLFDVADLYQALRGRFGGKDRDGDGHDDIDQLFAAHGLFADDNGNRQLDSGETLGLTSHPGRTVQVGGETQAWPDLTPRYQLALPPALQMSLEVEPSDATVMVLVAGSSWGGYLARAEADGNVRVVPPPAREGYSVSVVGLAADRQPTVLWHQDATALLTEFEGHAAPYLAVQAELAAAAEGPTSTPHTMSGWPRLAFGGGALAALVGLVLMAIGWPRMR